jgi:hypothetical protein
MTHLEIVQKLIGPVTPVGETNEDQRRFENLKQMCELAGNLLNEIGKVGESANGRHEASVKKVAAYACVFLNNI